jgi:hypothetical protein
MVSTVSGGPNIITDGLVLYLDASNTKSYPGTGTTWSDLTRNGNNATLVNGPTFSSANGGSIVFDGTNDSISFISNPTITNQVTISTWCNMDPSNINGTSIIASAITGRELSYRLIYSSNSVQWAIATTNNAWYTTGTNIGAFAQNNTWFNVTAIYSGQTIFLYVNGILQATGGSLSGNLLSTVNNFSIMGNTASNITFGRGRIANYQVYNRTLSAREIFQNFNTTKTRFGL